MKALFEVATGSVIGQEHLRLGKNNQDAVCWLQSEQATIALVCDGCSGSVHSEVGAKLGARLTVTTLARLLAETTATLPSFWQRLQQDLLVQLRDWSDRLGENLYQTLHDYFLFTFVGVVITPAGVTLFSLGDGVVVLNGEVIELGPFPENAPPYLAYGLMSDQVKLNPEALTFQLRQVDLDQVDTLLLGTDGVMDLIAVAHQKLPGKAEMVGAIAQFWEQDCYFSNPDMVRRRLSLINRSVTQPDWSTQSLNKTSGLLPDDTTLVVLRKR